MACGRPAQAAPGPSGLGATRGDAWAAACPAAARLQRRHRPAPAVRLGPRPTSTTSSGVKNAYGGTVNDVVLSVVTGALGHYLRARGHDTEGLELRAMVPVSVRAEEEHGALGNRISAMMAPLPVWCEDPVERLHLITETMGDLKGSGQAVGAES